MFVGVLGRSVEHKLIANIRVPDFYLGFFVLKIDKQVVFALQQEKKKTFSDVAGDVQSYLMRIDLNPCTVTLKKGMLTVHYSSSEEAMNSSMKLLGAENFVQPMQVASYVMSLCSICGYMLKNTCVIRELMTKRH